MLIICTYRRRDALKSNLKRIIGSRFFDRGDELFGKLDIYIVDNASELMLNDIVPESKTYDNIKLYHNPNTGGSGGFTRGMQEVRKAEHQGEAYTHVILMDDDAKILAESLHRLYSFLLLMKSKYSGEVIAGRMFDIDRPHIQYTAAEIWNGGKLRHIGYQRNMCDERSLVGINDAEDRETGESAEYSGWWFACFPIAYIKANDPLPLFLHCDDVEYGLRHGGVPIILNGVQVWHETAEKKQTAVVDYYDYRNALIVNKLYGLSPDIDALFADWIEKISEYHVRRAWMSEYMTIIAMRDYLRGLDWLKKKDIAKHHRKLLKIRTNRLKNAVMWRRVKYLNHNRN